MIDPSVRVALIGLRAFCELMTPDLALACSYSLPKIYDLKCSPKPRWLGADITVESAAFLVTVDSSDPLPGSHYWIW